MAVLRHNILEDISARDRFIDCVHRLKDEQTGSDPSTYDALVIWHHRAMHQLTPQIGNGGRNAAHGGPVFLPWHRFFLLLLEVHIQRVLADPSFGLPYWAWNRHGQLPAAQQRETALWDDDCMGALLEPVTSGRFAQTAWPVRVRGRLNGLLAVENRALVRSPPSRLTLPTELELVRALQNDVYDRPEWETTAKSFRNALEGRHPFHVDGMLHDRVHRWVGGDMAGSTSPNDPVFFLHHANVDRIWAAWMQRHPQSPYLPDSSLPDTLRGHRISDPMFFPFGDSSPTPGDVLDVSELYSYDTLDDLL